MMFGFMDLLDVCLVLKKHKKGDWKTMAVMVLTLVGILLLMIVMYRVVFKGGLLKP